MGKGITLEFPSFAFHLPHSPNGAHFKEPNWASGDIGREGDFPAAKWTSLPKLDKRMRVEGSATVRLRERSFSAH